jgi:hypothetical protein
MTVDDAGEENKSLLQRLNDSLESNYAAIAAILAAYHVPTLPETFALPQSAQR